MVDKPSWLFRQSAVVPVFGGKVVVITSRKKKRWVIPKGVVEQGMTPAESAAKEALEEAGIIGSLRPGSLGVYRYEKWGGTCTVEVFVLDVEQLLPEWDESHFRDRDIVSFAEAVDRVDEPELKQMVASLA